MIKITTFVYMKKLIIILLTLVVLGCQKTDENVTCQVDCNGYYNVNYYDNSIDKFIKVDSLIGLWTVDIQLNLSKEYVIDVFVHDTIQRDLSIAIYYDNIYQGGIRTTAHYSSIRYGLMIRQ